MNFRACQVNDVVAFRGLDGSFKFGQVYFHVQCLGQLRTCVSEWPIVSISDNRAKVRHVVSPRLVKTDDIVESCVFKSVPEGSLSHVLFLRSCRRASMHDAIASGPQTVRGDSGIWEINTE